MIVLSLRLIFTGLAWVSPQMMIRDTRGPGVIEQAIVLPAGQLTRPVAERLAREFFARHRASDSILLLTMGEDEMEVRASLYHQYAAIRNENYPKSERITQFLKDVKRAGLPKQPLARLIALGQSALLSYRDREGLTERLLSGTHDPTRMEIAGIIYRLVHISVTEASDAVRERDRYSARLYFHASPRVSFTGGVSLLKRLAALTRIRYIDVEIRPDVWFIESNDYPLIPVFTQDLTLPNPAQYVLAPRLGCGVDSRSRVRCSGQNFEP